jgi:hypothetical protein
MEAAKINFFGIDIIFQDRNGKPIILVAAKSRELQPKEAERAITQLESHLQVSNQNIPFAMLVDAKNIKLFQWDGNRISTPVVILETASVLQEYEPKYGQKKIFWSYFETLVEAWLRDLAYHWKSKTPPEIEKLAEIGLLQHLQGGTTISGTDFNGYSL